MNRLIYGKLGAAALFWGAGAVAGKFALAEAGPATVTFGRFFAATTILLGIAAAQRQSLRLAGPEHRKVAVLGFVGVTLCYFFYCQGLYASTAFNAGLIEATVPLVTLAFAVVSRRERLHLVRAFGFAVACLGIVVIVARGNPQNLITMSFNRGDMLLLLSTVCFGAYNVLTRAFTSDTPDTVRTLYIFLYGTIGLVPWLLRDWATEGTLLHPTIRGVAATIFLAAGSSVLAYVFFNEGVRLLGASRASGFINLVPVATAVLAMAVLRELPTVAEEGGAVMVLLGVALGLRERARSLDVAPAPEAKPRFLPRTRMP